jgi:hypothetical protein
MSAPTYEFTPEQNIIVAHLATRMKIVGGVLFALAVLVGAQSFLSFGTANVPGLEIGIILGLVGYWSGRAGAALEKVVTTQGADISHLMRALGEIRKLYELQFWLLIGLAALLVATLLAALTRVQPLPAAW